MSQASRSARRPLAVLGVAVVALLVAAAPAAADSTYPAASGSTFTTGSDGWIDTEHSCTFLTIPNVACSVRNGVSATEGAPPGALSATYSTAVNLFGLAVGTSRFTSPTFTVAAAPTGDAKLRIGRRAEIQALVDVGGQVRSTVTLVDETAKTSRTLLTEQIVPSSTLVAHAPVTVPASALVPGDRDHLEITTGFTSSTLQAAFGTMEVDYDNVALGVPDQASQAQPPIVQTLPVTGIDARSALLGAGVDPNGQPTTYRFEYGTSASYGATTPERSAGAGMGDVAESEPLAGLEPATTYHVRVVAANATGSAAGQDVTFTTPPPDATGFTTPPPGAAGSPGAPGASGSPGSASVTLSSLEVAKRLLRIDTRSLRLREHGRFGKLLRVRVYCRSSAAPTCSGTVKIRSVGKMNPSVRRAHHEKTRVTFGTGSYQLDRGKIGFVHLPISSHERKLIHKRGHVRVRITVTVLDVGGNRQQTSRVVTLRG